MGFIDCLGGFGKVGDIFIFASSRTSEMKVGIVLKDEILSPEFKTSQVEVKFMDFFGNYENNNCLICTNIIDIQHFSPKAFVLNNPEFYINNILVQKALQVRDLLRDQGLLKDG